MNDNLKKLLNQLIDLPAPEVHIGTVVAIDGQEVTIDPLRGGPEIEGVRLRPVSDGKEWGWTIYPKLNTAVCFSYLDGSDTEAVVLLVAEPDSIELKTEDGFTLEINNIGQLIFNGGAHEGLVIVQELVDKINRLENKVNDLITKHNTHVHPGVMTGIMSTGPTPTSETPISPVTVKADLENPDITH